MGLKNPILKGLPGKILAHFWAYRGKSSSLIFPAVKFFFLL
jgi:hypothetical protein